MSPEGRVDKEDKCPSCLHLEKTVKNKNDEVTELKNSIDRLNAQVSYHIFSNTQLQKEVDKLKAGRGSLGGGQEALHKEIESLRKELNEAAEEKTVLIHQI